MHLGFYLDEWREGGVPAFIARALRGLAKFGDETTLFLARPHPKREPAARALYQTMRDELGARCVSLDLSAYPEKWAQDHLVRTIAESEVACLFASQFRAQQNALRALSRHVPVVGIAHNDLDYYYQEYFDAQDFLASEVAVSQAVFETCQRGAQPAFRARLCLIPYGVETGDVPSPQPREAPPAFLYCSRLDPAQKRSLDLVPIWKSYCAGGGTGTLTVIGSGKAEPELQAGLAGEIARGSVRLLGHLGEAEVFRAMCTSDIILNVSNFEGLPQTVLEGASLGAWPLLSRTRSGHVEIVATLDYGTLCEIGDTAGFTREMLALAGRIDGLRASRSTRAESARTIYSAAKCFRFYHDLAARLAAESTPQPLPAAYVPTLRARAHRAFLLANYRRQMH